MYSPFLNMIVIVSFLSSPSFLYVLSLKMEVVQILILKDSSSLGPQGTGLSDKGPSRRGV